MVISDENNSNSTIMPRNFRGLMGENRRPLSVINQNLVKERPYPCVANKRVLSEIHEICEKKLVDPVHRSITRRRFAALITSSQQSNAEKTKKSNPLISNLNEFGDSIIAIDDEHKLPALEATETVLSDLDEKEEVEMEDSDEEEILDIDSSDANNSLAVVEYVEDLHSYYRIMECIGCVVVPPNYMEEQVDINEKMRAILIDWLIKVHNKFDLMQETLFLTVNLIDRYLSKQTVIRKKLQLVGLVAMLLACKYEEVSPSVPSVANLIQLSDRAYKREEVLEMEKLMLNTLQFNMSVPTPCVFIRRFLKAAQADKKLELVAFFLAELSLVESEMLKFPPSLLAAAAVYTAQCTVNGFSHWDKTCQWHTSYSEDHLFECSSLMVRFHQKAGEGKLTGVHWKYCSSKFSYAAKCEPACFLLENQL